MAQNWSRAPAHPILRELVKAGGTTRLPRAVRRAARPLPQRPCRTNARFAGRRLLMHLDDAAAGKRSEGRDSTQNRPIEAICRMDEASKGGKRLRHVDERQREAAARHRSEPRRETLQLRSGQWPLEWRYVRCVIRNASPGRSQKPRVADRFLKDAAAAAFEHAM